MIARTHHHDIREASYSPQPIGPSFEARNGHEEASSMPATLGDTEIWIHRHPASGLPSGYATEDSEPEIPIEEPVNSKLPPYFPLRTQADFLQAEIFSRNNCSDGHINDQLSMLHQTGAYRNVPPSERLTLKNAADYHATLARSCGASDHVCFP
jgi:hypothetical protein